MGNTVKGARAKLYGKTDKRTKRVSSQPTIPPQDQVNLTIHLCNIHDQIWGGSDKMFKLTHLKVSILNYQVLLFSFVFFLLRSLWDDVELTLKNNMLICSSSINLSLIFVHVSLLYKYLLGGLYLLFSYLLVFFYFLKGVAFIMELDRLIFKSCVGTK